MARKRECSVQIGECEGKVTYGEDPFLSQVYDDHKKVWMCERHRQQAADDA